MQIGIGLDRLLPQRFEVGQLIGNSVGRVVKGHLDPAIQERQLAQLLLTGILIEVVFRPCIQQLQIDLISLDHVGVALLQLRRIESGEPLGVIQSCGEQSSLLVQKDQVQTDRLGLEQDLLAERRALPVEPGGTLFRQLATLIIERGEIERLRGDELTRESHILLVSPEMRIGDAGIGQVIIEFRLHFLGLERLIVRLQLLVVGLDLPQDLVHRERLRARRQRDRGASQA